MKILDSYTTIPSFTIKQLQEHYGHKDIKVIFMDSVKSAIESFDDFHTSKKDMILIAVREKMEEDDYRIGVACIPMSNFDDAISISLHGFSNIKEMFIITKNELYSTFKRIIKNLSFT